jgi:hypothetical protein
MIHQLLIIIIILFLQGMTAFNLILEIAKETNKTFYSPTAYNVSDFKLLLPWRKN